MRDLVQIRGGVGARRDVLERAPVERESPVDCERMTRSGACMTLAEAAETPYTIWFNVSANAMDFAFTSPSK